MTGVGHHWTRQADTVVQGVTRSSKSGWTYGALAQMAGRPELLIAGCDPAGLLQTQLYRRVLVPSRAPAAAAGPAQPRAEHAPQPVPVPAPHQSGNGGSGHPH